MKKLGLIINPIAGMGGSVGLKGTDGAEILERARFLGASPQSQLRAAKALGSLTVLKEQVQFITGYAEMGENVARAEGFAVEVVGEGTEKNTTAKDTIRVAGEMAALKVDLLLFAGGDGTAKDIYEAVGDKIPCLGIPTGVKMHSAVFATSPHKAGQLALSFITGKSINLQPAEVMDLDEEAFRLGQVSAELYGYLNIPFGGNNTQRLKSGSQTDEKGAFKEIAYEIINKMKQDWLYVIGPGTTTNTIKEQLGISGTLLGVDIIRNRQLVAKDANEEQLLKIIDGDKCEIIVTIIGGQGYLFGRGNQQISYKVISKVGKENIKVVATRQKIFSLKGLPILVDTGSEKTDHSLSGFIRVIVGRNQHLVYKVSS